MLKELRIKDLILVDSAEIPFAAGFNVITGETGAGKSAIMSALALIAGGRGDSSLVRKGAGSATIQALFDIEKLPKVQALLEEGGISGSDEPLLIIQREVASSGKGRIFINQQPVQLQFLKQVGEQLLHIVGQHANQILFDSETPRRIVDLYGGLSEQAECYARLWSEWNAMKKRRDQLACSESERLRRIQALRMETAEISKAAVKEEEAEELFAAYTLLTNAEERSAKCDRVDRLLNSDGSALVHLEREKETLEALAAIDPAVAEIADSYASALLDLREVAYSISRYQGNIEFHPSKLEEVNKRLTLIDQLNRKYGTPLNGYLQKAKEELSRLENSDNDIEALEALIAERGGDLDSRAALLTRERRSAAEALGSALTAELQTLNMEKALLEVRLAPQPRNGSGEDAVEWFLTPNVGEGSLPLRSCASGGELSRLLLALHALLAGKEGAATLIFDEVDANIGGKTAAIVGEKLRAIGERQQLLCITHFPQVAKQGNHHLQISKVENDGRTQTQVALLTGKTKERELSRMVGA